MSDASARAASDAAHHYDETLSPYSGAGYQNNMESRRIPCSRVHAEDVSAPMRSNGSSPGMSPPRGARVPRWPGSM